MLDATPLLAAYAMWRRRQLARQDPRAAQQRQLMALLAKAAATEFGRRHRFDGIRSVAQFQQRVPLRRFRQLDEEYWRSAYPRLSNCTWPGTIPYFAVTSGTASGVSKHIPVSRAMIAANRRAALDVLVHHLAACPRSRVFGGKTLMLGGSTDLVAEPGGAWRGDLSGIAFREVPWWALPFSYPPRQVALMSDWDGKTDIMARASLDQDIRAVSGTANWLQLFLDKLMSLDPSRGRRLSAFYPRLELIVHGGVDFRPYRGHFQRILEGTGVDLREVYAASEGFIAVADRGYGEGMRLILDNGLFFEFVPVEELPAAAPTRHWVGTIETGVDYVVVLSSCAGLWAYMLDDTIRFVEGDWPRLLITGRTSYFLSAFGEHLSGEQIDQAVAGAAEALRVELTDFSVGPVFPDAEQRAGRHLVIAELSMAAPTDPSFAAAFAAEVDSRLRRANLDYRDLRAGDFGLLPPRVQLVPPGTFSRWMRRRGRLGGQNKVPRVIGNAELFGDLRHFCDDGNGRP